MHDLLGGVRGWSGYGPFGVFLPFPFALHQGVVRGPLWPVPGSSPGVLNFKNGAFLWLGRTWAGIIGVFEIFTIPHLSMSD